jgi:outer membrane lipoprotein-sorting protein
MKKAVVFTFALIVSLFVSLTLGWAAELSGKEIVRRAREQEFPEKSEARVRMTLVDNRGWKRERHFTLMRKSIGKDTKIMIRFISPPDIRGTGYLINQTPGAEDEFYIYFPATKKLRRVKSKEGSKSFMGSDFTNYDLKQRDIEEDTHKLLRTETVGGKDCYVVENIPKRPDEIGYSRTISWIRRDIFVTQKTDFYDREGRLLKQLLAEKVEKIEDLWTITRSRMENIINGHQTIMELEEIEFDSELPDSLFTKRELQKG